MTGSKDPYRLPVDTRIGNVHLRVSDMETALGFYDRLLGFRQVSQEGNSVSLSASAEAPARVILTESKDARPRALRTTGLFHVAVRFPNRIQLARTLRHLLQRGYPVQGYADHGVSDAAYLADPDGNGIELYADTPDRQWTWQNGQVQMVTEPLDVQALLAEARSDMTAYTSIDPSTDIGHVHLQVSSLEKAEEFYHQVLGFDITQRSYPGALFMSAGGYHHHVGVNVWASRGAKPSPPGSLGLLSFGIVIPTRDVWDSLKARLMQAGFDFQTRKSQEGHLDLSGHDGDGIGVELHLDQR